MRWNQKLERKREKRIERLVQKYGLLEYRKEISKVWGWKARRRTVHSMAQR